MPFKKIGKAIGKGLSGLSGSLGSLGGPLVTGGLSLIGGWMGNEASAKQAERQMRFQERMSNTSHQREVADLRAAGLNPILSAHSGASSPGGASASQSDIVTPAVSSAREAARVRAEIENLRETNKNIQKQNSLIESQTKKADAERNLTEMDTMWRELLFPADYELRRATTASAQQVARMNQMEADMYASNPTMMPLVKGGSGGAIVYALENLDPKALAGAPGPVKDIVRALQMLVRNRKPGKR